MARASSYYYTDRQSCMICFEKTKQVWDFKSDNYDLDDTTVRITIHLICRLKKNLSFLFMALSIAVSAYFFLLLFETSLIHFNLSSAQFFVYFFKKPVWLTVINVIIASIAGLFSYLKFYYNFCEFINKEIHLNTIPID
jgi:hypothetical protein